MAIKIAHSSIDENGKISGGVAGDQNKQEVCIRYWWDKGWNIVIRFKDEKMAKKFAAAMEAIAANNNIGYAQDSRNTLLIEAEKVGWDISKITTPCECDCSSAITVAAIVAGVPKTALYIGGNCATTRTLKDRLNATGLVEIFIDSEHLRSDKQAKIGDIYLKEGSHVIAAIENGEGIKKPNSNNVQTNASTQYKEGDVIKLKEGATYYNGKAIPSWVFKKTLYYRGSNKDGIIFSTLKIGAITGVVKPEMIEGAATAPNSPSQGSSAPAASYMVKVTATALNIRKGPGVSYPVVGWINDQGTYTIVETQGNWGKLKSGAGWISLKYTKRV